MRNKILRWVGLISILLWIPLSIVAFFLSPAELYIKLLIAAATSFVGMLVLWLKIEQ